MTQTLSRNHMDDLHRKTIWADMTAGIDESLMETAGRILREGGLVAFPTETVYGLGANALDAKASARIYAAKGRPSDNPLIVHIARLKSLESIVREVPEKAGILAEAFWPGPLTIILPKGDLVPRSVTGGLDTVAVRMPDHEIALALIRAGSGFVAAPSANTSGRPSPTTAQHVRDDLDGRIDMIIDGGSVDIGVESTIVDLTEDVPTVLRPGYISLEMLRDVIGEVRMDPGLQRMDPQFRPKAPGMKYRHYAPKAASSYHCGIVRSAGSRAQEITISQHLFGILREFDDLGVDVIYSESFDTPQIGTAIMNRLIKAAGHRILKV